MKEEKIMKKKFALLSACVLVMAATTSCGKNQDEATTTTTTVADATTVAEDTTAAEDTTVAEDTTAATEEATAEAATVMSYADYVAADVDTAVTVETYVQATQSWWDNTITAYTQDADGAYFIYGMACSEEDAAKLVPGTKIKVSGYKSIWSGEVEIVDATFEFVEGADSYIAPATDVTAFLGTDDIENYMNQFVSFKGLTVEAASEDGAAFLYKYDGSGADGDDLYFNVSDANGNKYSFTVESYLCDNTTDVYSAVKNLTVGQKVDLEGFLYWYEGVNPHITAVTVVE